MDPTSPLMSKAIKLKAAERYSVAGQKLMKMMMKDMADLGINNQADFHKYITKILRKGKR